MKKCLVVLIVVAVLAGQAGATVRTWNGSVGGNWFTTTQWNPNGSPASTDNLTINSGSPVAASTVSVSDGGSIAFSNSSGSFSNLYIGDIGIGTIDITNGADVNCGSMFYAGHLEDSTGTATINGTGSTLKTSGMTIGYNGSGTLNITDGAYVTSGFAHIGYFSTGTGTVIVDGEGSLLNTNTGTLYIGDYGSGTLNITNGGRVFCHGSVICNEGGSEGTVTVDGYGSSWFAADYLYVGYDDAAVAALNISNDAQVTTAGYLNIGARGTVNLSGGLLSAANISGPAGSLNFTGGELEIAAGDVTISGSSPLGSYLSLASGQILDVQNGTTAVDSGSILNVNNGLLNSKNVQNDGYLIISNGGLVNATGGFVNSSSMNMYGGTIQADKVFNDFGASFSAEGKVNSALDNYGTIDLEDVLTVAGSMNNYGSVNIFTSETLRQNGGLNNYGIVNLDGGAITGDGMIANYGIIRGGSAIGSYITNDGGLIHADGSSALLISNIEGNFNGGEMRVDDGASINVLTSLFNNGAIVLNGPDAAFLGKTIWNDGGIITGRGRISNPINSSGSGVIRASGGDLTLAGNFTNAGRIEVLDDSAIRVTQGLASNDGDITLQGGSFDNVGHTLTNTMDGSITGFGTLRSGGLTNKGHIGVGVEDLWVISPVIQDGSCDIEACSTAVFFDDVSGSGTFGGTGTAMFLGNLSPGSSPGIMSFQTNVTLGSGSNLIMEFGGLVRGDEYDALVVGGDFVLDGILDIVLISKFVPQYGNVFDILDFNPANLFGTFDSINLPALSAGLSWNTSSLYTIGEITVVPEPATIALLGLGALTLPRRKKH